MADVLGFVLRFIVLVPAVVVHEVSHGYSAYMLGDPTAKRAGRLTLNPLAHVDAFGTVILPILLLLGTGGRAVFGYAKPVPFNPMYFQDRRTGTLITGLAGPASNLALAVACAAVLRVGLMLGLDRFAVPSLLLSLFDYSVYINLLLLFFNLLPIPGLDGSHVVQRFLPDRMRVGYVRASRYMFLILFAVLYFAPGLLWGYLSWTVDPIYHVLTGLRPF
ncbi:MAG: site-2 protease family protein [Coriobacteriia bacterium]